MRFLIAIFLSVVNIHHAQTQWVIMDSLPSSVINHHYVSNDTGIAVTTTDIFKTTDGGQSWELKDSFSGISLNDVFFPTPDTGYIVGNAFGAAALKTIDGGNNWSFVQAFPYNPPEVHDIFFTDNERGHAACDVNIVTSTADGFQNTWDTVLTASGNPCLLYTSDAADE